MNNDWHRKEGIGWLRAAVIGANDDLTRMMEEHYGHLCETAKLDAIRTSAPRIFSSLARTVETEPESPSRRRKRR